MATKIFVGSISDMASESELRMLFEEFGVVSECSIIKNYGFVHMAQLSDAKKAIESLNGYNFKGTKLSVELSTNATQGRRSKQYGDDRSSSGRGGKTKIFVGGIEEGVSDSEIKKLFEQFGSVAEAAVIRNYAFVHMNSLDDAKTAIEGLQGYKLKGAKINVELSRNEPRRNPTRSNDNYSRPRYSDRYDPYGISTVSHYSGSGGSYGGMGSSGGLGSGSLVALSQPPLAPPIDRDGYLNIYRDAYLQAYRDLYRDLAAEPLRDALALRGSGSASGGGSISSATRRALNPDYY